MSNSLSLITIQEVWAIEWLQLQDAKRRRERKEDSVCALRSTVVNGAVAAAFSKNGNITARMWQVNVIITVNVCHVNLSSSVCVRACVCVCKEEEDEAKAKAKSSSDEIISHFCCLLKRAATLWMFHAASSESTKTNTKCTYAHTQASQIYMCTGYIYIIYIYILYSARSQSHRIAIIFGWNSSSKTATNDNFGISHFMRWQFWVPRLGEGESEGGGVATRGCRLKQAARLGTARHGTARHNCNARLVQYVLRNMDGECAIKDFHMANLTSFWQ